MGHEGGVGKGGLMRERGQLWEKRAGVDMRKGMESGNREG